jgi:hypothetical protein
MSTDSNVALSDGSNSTGCFTAVVLGGVILLTLGVFIALITL